MVIGALLNGVGMAVKGLSTWDLVTPADQRFTVTMIGSVRPDFRPTLAWLRLRLRSWSRLRLWAYLQPWLRS